MARSASRCSLGSPLVQGHAPNKEGQQAGYDVAASLHASASPRTPLLTMGLWFMAQHIRRFVHSPFLPLPLPLPRPLPPG